MGLPKTCLPPELLSRWRITTALLAHQHAAVKKLRRSRVGALFMEMGTGKTLTALALIHLALPHIDHVVWFCPVSLKRTARREILKHTDCTEDNIYIFDQRTDESRLPDAFWHIVGIESMSSSARTVFSVDRLVTDKTFVVVDESSFIKGHKSKRTERIIHMCDQTRYRLILNGTPISQGVEDLFTQMRFLSPKILGYPSWYGFARAHLIYSDRYPGMVKGYFNTEKLANRMQPYVYQITKKECLDLPKKLYESHYCDLTLQQLTARELILERFQEEVLAYEVEMGREYQDHWSHYKAISTAIFRMFTDLQKMVCGFDVEGNAIPHHRMKLLEAVVRQIPRDEKVVIWCKYHLSINEIHAYLTEAYGKDSVCLYHGKLNERQRHAQLTRWRKKSRFLVATQSMGGYGLDMVEAGHAIFYSNGFRYAERLQAEDRMHRIGQKRSVIYIDLWAETGIEQRIQQSMRRKESVVAAFRRDIERVKDVHGGELAELLGSL
jgi:SNF2 family DNA or RNA helicase